MAELISFLETYDVRFPTSRQRDGSDAMNPFPDYSAAYVVVRTSAGREGYGLAFTVGRGNEVQVAGIRALTPLVVGRPLRPILDDMAGFSRQLTGDSQLRWLGPEKGVIHMAAGAVVNAVWDLAARAAGKPLWKLLADLSPDQIVSLVDFRYLRDAVTEDEALELLKGARGGGRAGGGSARPRLPCLHHHPRVAGLRRRETGPALAPSRAGRFRTHQTQGRRRSGRRLRRRVARAAVGPDMRIAVDANQIWGVEDAVDWVRALEAYQPYWIEEPTSPDDVLGHAAIRRGVAPIKVAAGEHVRNAVMFKQLLQAGAVDIVQIDACRVAGVNENIAVLLLAAKFGVPVCPHAGGVGLCEMVQHLAMFDYLAVSGTCDDRTIEYVDHLHEHFVHPVRIMLGRYLAPLVPGGGAQLQPASVAAYAFPGGERWSGDAVAVGPAP